MPGVLCSLTGVGYSLWLWAVVEVEILKCCFQGSKKLRKQPCLQMEVTTEVRSLRRLNLSRFHHFVYIAFFVCLFFLKQILQKVICLESFSSYVQFQCSILNCLMFLLLCSTRLRSSKPLLKGAGSLIKPGSISHLCSRWLTCWPWIHMLILAPCRQFVRLVHPRVQNVMSSCECWV